MPELPEVETIRRQLIPYLPLKIVEVKESIHSNSILLDREFDLKNKTITSIDRKGKKLIFHLQDLAILSGLGMSGSWQFHPVASFSTQKRTFDKHDHLILKVEGAEKAQKYYLIYNDPRRFGKMHLLTSSHLQPHLNKMGIDATSKDLSKDYLKKILLRYPERMLKVTLLDQTLISGIGNYLASEICAHAQILPTRKCQDIKDKEWNKILYGIKKSLDTSIKQNGNSFHGGYKDLSGEEGDAVDHLVVFYQEKCQLCQKTPVVKTTLAGRGTYHCPRCQR